MAGIGWRLERWIERDTLSSSVGAILTGVAVTSGPWLLTTAVLVIMRVTAVASGAPDVTDGERVITVVYAVVIVSSAPVGIVLTRYIADCVYVERWDRIAAPLRRTVAVGVAVFVAIGAVSMWISRVPVELHAPGTVLAAIVGAQWLLLSAAGGLSSPGIILRAFAIGAPVSAASWVVLRWTGGFGTAGYLCGFATGQIVTLGLLLRGVFRALPEEEEEERARVLPSIRTYWLLAAGAFTFNAGLWIDKLVVLVAGGGGPASEYAAVAAVAWLSVVPACAHLFVAVETGFHRRFSAFYGAVHAGATLGVLEARARELRREVDQTLLGTAAVQAGVTLLCLVAVPPIVGELGLVGKWPHSVEWLLLGSCFQMMAVAATVLLYYFDFRLEAFVVAATQLVTNTAFTTHVGLSDLLGAGYAFACAITAAVAVVLLRWRSPTLLVRTFQGQPFETET